MNLLREHIRELLTEAAKGPQDLPDGIWVRIKEDDWGVEVGYVNKLGNVISQKARINGLVMVENIPEDDVEHFGRCGGAWMIGSAQAAPGWGPMLYDIAMEYATMKGGGLMADRGSVSPSARKVWDYYMKNRGDVTGIQMDDFRNTLTPEEEDNCDQEISGGVAKWIPDHQPKDDWVKSPLSKRYTKPPTTIEALRAAGKLVWHEAGDYLPMRDLDEEGPIMHLEQYIREILLTESTGIHSKIMELIERAERLGYKFKLKSDTLIMFDPVKVEMKGKIRFENPSLFGPCDGAVMVGSSSAEDGLGPLMYDVLIEYSGGLISDRYSVSPAAVAVWDRYMNDRPDIEAVQLDDLRNTLTPVDEDNCNQEVSRADYGTRGNGWPHSSLSKMYRKKGGGTPVMDELRKRGMLK